MFRCVIAFDPQPAPVEVPRRFPTPFAAEPHPLARRAAREMAAALDVSNREPGKMFGALVVADARGTIGYLRAFSGMLDGRWLVDGFAPPAFDVAARDAFWPAGEAALAAIDVELAAAEAALAAPAAARAALAGELAAAEARLRATLGDRRAARHAAAVRTDALDAESRTDGRALRALRAAHARALADADAAIAPLRARRDALATARAARSRGYLVQIHDTYAFADARGDRRRLRDIFAPAEPPGGAGDCAAPKLLADAYRRGLRPIALAEVWLGAPPLAGGRTHGSLYPACRGKCGPILAHVLGGLDHEPPPAYARDIAPDEPRAVYDDPHLVVVAKPCGLLSVPGRGDALRDCAQARLRARYGDATTVVHRLDQDTSGLLLAVKDAATYAALQRAFAERAVAKTYAAVLDGAPPAHVPARGDIALALRVDLDDRPRQIHDPVDGKAALTSYVITDQVAGRTHVSLVPRTGRTHQLRVHAAHPLGLATPIAGDRLYGRAGSAPRLLLHACALAFTHPHTGARIELRSPIPW
nr:RluA family pseudouridine synthase [Kofleriaceae bacterium]